MSRTTPKEYLAEWAEHDPNIKTLIKTGKLDGFTATEILAILSHVKASEFSTEKMLQVTFRQWDQCSGVGRKFRKKLVNRGWMVNGSDPLDSKLVGLRKYVKTVCVKNGIIDKRSLREAVVSKKISLKTKGVGPFVFSEICEYVGLANKSCAPKQRPSDTQRLNWILRVAKKRGVNELENILLSTRGNNNGFIFTREMIDSAMFDAPINQF